MNNRQYRFWQFLLLAVTMFVLMASFYFQYTKGMQPCPLCIMQRFSVMILLALGMMALFIGKNRPARLIAAFFMIIALAGLYFASRQLWLQSLPDNQIPACLPGLDVLIRYFPWQDIVHALIWGAGDCAEVSWQWLGLPMAAWSALYFIAMFFAGLLNFKLFLKR